MRKYAKKSKNCKERGKEHGRESVCACLKKKRGEAVGVGCWCWKNASIFATKGACHSREYKCVYNPPPLSFIIFLQRQPKDNLEVHIVEAYKLNFICPDKTSFFYGSYKKRKIMCWPLRSAPNIFLFVHIVSLKWWEKKMPSA